MSDSENQGMPLIYDEEWVHLDDYLTLKAQVADEHEVAEFLRHELKQTEDSLEVADNLAAALKAQLEAAEEQLKRGLGIAQRTYGLKAFGGMGFQQPPNPHEYVDWLRDNASYFGKREGQRQPTPASDTGSEEKTNV